MKILLGITASVAVVVLDKIVASLTKDGDEIRIVASTSGYDMANSYCRDNDIVSTEWSGHVAEINNIIYPLVATSEACR